MNTITRTDKKTLSDAQAIRKAMGSIAEKIARREPDFRTLGVNLTTRHSNSPDAFLNSNHGNVHCKLTFLIGASSHRINFSLSTKDWEQGKVRRDKILKLLSGSVAQ